ncbi:MAG: nucleoside-diphosphate kinase [Bacteroidales bacterium]|nr:nucleoside-diphosphate kinase [Bacteroidales bacterium]MBN2819280.1 nucleoside-diphosphate kinase [Bacteroidales bacterium]
MAGTKTLTIIKPGAVSHEYIGPILNKINEAGFHISAMRLFMLNRQQAGNFYQVHAEKPFYNSLIEFMTSGPVVVAILEKENAVIEYRRRIGHTDPSKAEPGTIRKMFAESMERNAVHGSDSDENAEIECDFFFSKSERFSIFDKHHF